MARLDFDFHDRPRRASPAGLALSLAGALALAWSVQSWQAVRDARTGLAMQIADMQTARPVAASRSTPADAAARAAQARIAAQLAFSWQPAFDALAAAQDKRIALVALDASQAKSRMRLTAEARALEDAVAWIARLQTEAGVRSATLVQHEILTDSQERPVRFVVNLELDA
ncbi:MAG: hypothetical protein ACK4R8_09455 [Thiobacillus sp.]